LVRRRARAYDCRNMTPMEEFNRHWATAAECHRRGEAEGAILALHRALLARREDLSSQQLLCRLLYENPRVFVPLPAVAPSRPPGLTSVVVCSIDAGKFERVGASYARAFGGAPWELIGIHDARSLAEGYVRGFARARGEAIVFSHDDIDVLSADLGGSVARALEAVDVAGVVGTTRLTGPAHAWAGKGYSRGRIAEPAKGCGGLQLVVYNPAPGVTPGLEAIDGVFMAARREAVAAIGFDAETFDGFHLYDIDFSYRAHLSGRKVGITSEIVLRHDSEGGFDAKWEEYARRFVTKFPMVSGERVQNLMSRIPFADASSLVAYCARLDEVGRRVLADL
jgi:hypothetical protein